MFRALGRVVVLVDDQERALAFYRDVLGFEVLHDEVVAGFRYVHVGPGGEGDAGVWLMPATHDDHSLVGRQAGGMPLLVLYTDDLDEVRGRLLEHGVEVWADSADERSRSLHFRDVSGNVVIAAQLAP